MDGGCDLRARSKVLWGLARYTRRNFADFLREKDGNRERACVDGNCRQVMMMNNQKVCTISLHASLLKAAVTLSHDRKRGLRAQPSAIRPSLP